MAAQPYNVRRIAARAIRERLLYPAPEAIINVERDGEAVILHVNSGGNALASRDALLRAGYTVAPTDYDPFALGNYGVRLRITKGGS